MLIREWGAKDPQTHAIIGAAMQVHRTLGCGFLEAVYQESLAIELSDRGIPYVREHEFVLTYKGRRLACGYRVDFICFGEIIVELKALGSLSSLEEAQVLNYLRDAGLRRALLLNFGAESLESRRLIYGRDQSQ